MEACLTVSIECVIHSKCNILHNIPTKRHGGSWSWKDANWVREATRGRYGDTLR